MVLCLSTVGVAALTLRSICEFNFINLVRPRTIGVLRNGLVTYFGLGLFLTPEILNPYLRWK